MLGTRRGQPRGQAKWGEGQGGRGREGWLGAERGFPRGLCECLVQGKGSREGKQGGERARAVGAGRDGSGPRGDSQEGSVSAWYKARVAERASKVGRGPGW